ncbi:MAG: YdiU family protein, partial [Ilumatobacteraceae bacterium]|nr:YdiU family protein [Ilumatobacteraceae bacterium]
IDHAGRYAFGNQPQIAQWNLARLGETLLPLIADEPDAAIGPATDVLHSFPERFLVHWQAGMRAKLGLADAHDDDLVMIDDLLALMHAQRVDHTSLFRSLSAVVGGDAEPARALFSDPAPFDAWVPGWLVRATSGAADIAAVAVAMDRVNPIYTPRNHLVEEALAAATEGDLEPFDALMAVLAAPFDARPGLERYAEPATPAFAGGYQTFCGT